MQKTASQMKEIGGQHEVRSAKIREATELDDSLQLLQKVIIKEWPDNKDEIPCQVTAYLDFRDELSIQHGLICRG